MRVHCIGCGTRSPEQDEPSLLCPDCHCLSEYRTYLRKVFDAYRDRKNANVLFNLVAEIREDVRRLRERQP